MAGIVDHVRGAIAQIAGAEAVGDEPEIGEVGPHPGAASQEPAVTLHDAMLLTVPAPLLIDSLLIDLMYFRIRTDSYSWDSS